MGHRCLLNASTQPIRKAAAHEVAATQARRFLRPQVFCLSPSRMIDVIGVWWALVLLWLAVEVHSYASFVHLREHREAEASRPAFLSTPAYRSWLRTVFSRTPTEDLESNILASVRAKMLVRSPRSLSLPFGATPRLSSPTRDLPSA